MDKDPAKKYGLVYFGGAHEKLRYFTHYQVIPGEKGHDSIEVIFLDGSAGVIKAEFAKPMKGEKARWFEAKESIRRYPTVL